MERRNQRIDFYKAVLMFSVVWGHTINILLNGEQCDSNISWFLRSFDMPMFMLLSGFFLKFSLNKYSLWNLVINKTTYILFPAVFWSLLVSIGQKVHTMYFLWAVYLSSIVVIFVEQIKMRWLKFLIYFGIIALLHLTKIDFVNLSYLFPFFLLGYYTQSLDRNYPIVASLFILVICFWQNDYNIWSSGAYLLDKPLYMAKAVSLRFMIGVTGIFAMKMVFDMIYSYYFDKPHELQSAWGGQILNVGKETLALYILQAIATYGVLKILMYCSVSYFGYNPLLWNERLLIYVISPLVAFTIILFSMFIIKQFRRNIYLEKLFGFKLPIVGQKGCSVS